MFRDANEIMGLMNSIEYGWIDKLGNKHYEVDDMFSDNYILQSPIEVIKNKFGVCWDQVELERHYFKDKYCNIKTYFLAHYDNDKCPAHTFLTYEKNGQIYWFEHSWKKYRGIYIYDSINELLLDVRSKFIKFELNNNYNKSNLMLYEYKEPKFHISVQDFYKHCENGSYIDLDNV